MNKIISKMSLHEKYIDENKRYDEYYEGDMFTASLKTEDALTACKIAELESLQKYLKGKIYEIDKQKEKVEKSSNSSVRVIYVAGDKEYRKELKKIESKLQQFAAKNGLI